LRAGAFQSSSDLVDGRSCGVDVVDQDYCSGNRSADFKCAGEVSFSLAAAQTRLARSVLAAPEQSRFQGTAQPGSDQLGLIEAALAFTLAMKRYRDNDAPGEWFMLETDFQDIAEGSGEGNALSVLEVMDHFSKRVRKEEGGSRQVESVFALPASAAEALNGRRRLPALRTKWRRQGFQA